MPEVYTLSLMPKSNTMLEFQNRQHPAILGQQLTSKQDLNTKRNIIFEKERLLNGQVDSV